MDASSIAETIASYLNDRDDVAHAMIVEGEDPPSIGVESQGGERYFVTVTAA